MDVRSVFRGVILATACCHKTNWYSEINMTFNSVTLARTIWLPDDGPRTETCRSVFNVLMFQVVNFINLYTCSGW